VLAELHEYDSAVARPVVDVALVLDSEAIFIPGRVPRESNVAFWGAGTGPDKIEIVVGGGASGVRKRLVSATAVPVAEALPILLSIDPNAPDHAGRTVRRTLGVWAAAATAGVGLIARGRLLPTVDDAGIDVWRVGPLGPADLTWLRELAASFPPAAHALPVPDSRPMRIRSAESLIRDLWDAVADTLVRSPAAPRSVASPAFAAPGRTQVDDLAEWLADTTGGLSAGASLGLRIEALAPDAGPRPPAAAGAEDAEDKLFDDELFDDDELFELDADDHAGADDFAGAVGLAGSTVTAPRFRLVLQLRSTADPSLIVDAANLWDQPESVLARFGAQADTDMLLALRRGASVWPPLADVLAQASPSVLDLDDDALTQLLGPAAEELAGAGIEVLWPSALLDDGLTLRAAATPSSITPTPEKLTGGGFGLDALLQFQWQLTLNGDLLDPAEIAALSEAKRPLIRLRGRWVALDPAMLARLRRPPRTRMPMTEALGAVLAGSADIDGETVPVVAEGALADLAARVAGLAANAVSAPPRLDPPAGLAATLRPYQQRGVAWLVGMCDVGLGGCLADDMGLGKTIQVIALHLHRRAAKDGPTLVVCPASLLGTWEREVRRFAPELPVRRYHGGERHLRGLAVDEIVLVTYGVVLRDAAELCGADWGLVVADEAQHAKNPLSRTARELRKVAASAPARVALTGTPVENRLSELWAILDWTTPGLLGNLEAFTRRVAIPVERYKSPEATASFAALVRPFLLRRKKSDPGIAPELPPKTETDRIVPLAAEQVTLYEAVVRDALEEIANKDGIERHGLVFKLLVSLKQICNHPAQYLKQRAPLAGGRSGKLAAFDELTDVILAGGESMLVFSQFTQMATLLQQHLDARGIGSLYLHGGVPVHRRQEMVDEFQNGAAPVFLLSLKAGGTGLTLTRATHVIHYDRWWNPAVEDQATDRAYRIGQDRPVQVHRLIAEGTLEDRIAVLLERKRELAEAVVGSGEGWIAELSDDELTELVSLRAAL
jgi:superfamily II DNA or RNA helicase